LDFSLVPLLILLICGKHLVEHLCRKQLGSYQKEISNAREDPGVSDMSCTGKSSP
jgi:hypothetical protein